MALLQATRSFDSDHHQPRRTHSHMFSRFTASIAGLFGHRARSEPIPDHGTRIEPHRSLNRFRSESNLRTTHIHHASNSAVRPSTPAPVTSFPPSSSPPIVREPSLAATEICDPDSQDIADEIKARGIKIRDFAYPTSRPELNGTSTTITLTPVRESFDQYKGLAELEYRWTQVPRIYPVTGKTMRRLLDMGWLSQEEFDSRAHAMDIEELSKHDSRPHYPWKPQNMAPGERVPTLTDRKEFMMCRRAHFVQLDAIRRNADALAAQIERERKAGEEAQRRIDAHAHEIEARRQVWIAQLQSSPSRPGRAKRTRDGDSDDDDATEPTAMTNDHDDVFLDVRDYSDKKRLRLTPPAELQPSSSSPAPSYPCYPSSSSQRFPTHSKSYSTSSQASFSSSQYPLNAPAKQYPAPLSSYDPQLYPEAAEFASSQPNYRSDTPPADEVSTPPNHDDDDDQMDTSTQARPKPNITPGQKLVHPKTLKRNGQGLSRTQTFTQL